MRRDRRLAKELHLEFDSIHHPDQCAGQGCVIHHPSKHHMRKWPLHWRDDRGFMERICEHGIGHPDPDDVAYSKSIGRDISVHGCDRCCWTPETAQKEKGK